METKQTEKPILFELINIIQTRELKPRYAEDGRVLDIEPIQKSERTFLTFRLPKGQVFKVEIENEIYHELIMPNLLDFATTTFRLPNLQPTDDLSGHGWDNSK